MNNKISVAQFPKYRPSVWHTCTMYMSGLTGKEAYTTELIS